MKTEITYIALGTNKGDREANLRAARQAFLPSVQLLGQSPIYETEPWGYADQPDFLNQVVKAQTTLPPLELLAYLKGIEKRLGRVPTFRNAPRVIDLDILLYGELVFKNEQLTIPHLCLEERAFVLVPLSKLNSQFRHPVSGKTIRELLSQVDQTSVELYTT
ncbi:MAG: 2-amino-4-hydroxy-6-hydroxymethyldihydropteridine diphosphokinase [Chloroflexota bacterium]|nr:2-amino-4-hydroxy-6-hydroxymethyldihydropteridine diphosphokinase [Chloroflexota bacterium]